MLYKSLKLYRYSRLALANTEYFELNPRNKIQLILGPNGVGKSSLLSQLTPLPSNHQDFSKGGYKVLECSHNNNDYIVKNHFNVGGNKYEIIKNGALLYEGHSATVYREFVKQEFNLTQDIHDFMIGSTNFTTMSISERRNWFTKISDSDYTYAIQYFNKLKEQHRDAVGAVKLMQSRLVQESEKLLTPIEEEKHRYEIGILKDMLKNVLELKSPINHSRQSLFSDLEIQESNIINLSEDLRRYRSAFVNHEGFKSNEQIDTAIIDTQSNIQSISNDQAKLYDLLSTDQKTLKALQDSNTTSYKDIDVNIANLKQDRLNLLKDISLDIVVVDAHKTYDALLSISDVLNETFRSLPENSDKRLSRDSYISHMESKNKQEHNLNERLKLSTDLVIKRSEMERCKTHDEVKCPSCNHSWNLHYDPVVYNKLIQDIAINDKVIESINTDLVTLNKIIDENRSYLENYRTYSNIIVNWGILKPLWDHIFNSGTLFTNPRYLPTLLDKFKSDLLIWMKVEDIDGKIKEALVLKDVLSKDQETSVEALLKKIEQVEEDIVFNNSELRDKKTVLGRLKLYKQASVEMSTIATKIEYSLTLISNKQKQLTDLEWAESINKTIQLINVELVNRESMLSKVDIQKALVTDISSQIATLSLKAEVLKIAVDELSPSQGLIAKGLTGFINHFVSLVNSFTKKIWLYPMSLIPVEPDEKDEVELDYKFIVRVNDNFNVPDVSKCSAGQKEIIDLAFRVVSMVYLGLEAFPLFLDEFAKGFDKAHREQAHYVITNLLTSSNFTQIFMISHYENSYGSLVNADITALSTDNIGLPENLTINEHVVIK